MANRTRRCAQQFMRHHDTDLAFRAFQVDRSWYLSYWYAEPRRARTNRIVQGFAALSAFVGTLIAGLVRLGQLASKLPPDPSPYLSQEDVASAGQAPREAVRAMVA